MNWNDTEGDREVKGPDLRSHRLAGSWRIKETAESLFLIDADLPESPASELEELFSSVDETHRSVRAALEIESDGVKAKERKRLVNVWLYGSAVLRASGLLDERPTRRFYGTVNRSGVHLVAHGMAWNDPIVIDRAAHEVVHFWWCDEVGEAPSILNEGVAEYFERVISTCQQRTVNELSRSWRADSQAGLLRRLCSNDTLWKERAAGTAVYEIGGLLVAYLVEKYGLSVLKKIFLESYFEDDGLADRLGKTIGSSVEDLEREIDLWQQGD